MTDCSPVPPMRAYLVASAAATDLYGTLVAEYGVERELTSLVATWV